MNYTKDKIKKIEIYKEVCQCYNQCLKLESIDYYNIKDTKRTYNISEKNMKISPQACNKISLENISVDISESLIK